MMSKTPANNARSAASNDAGDGDAGRAPGSRLRWAAALLATVSSVPLAVMAVSIVASGRSGHRDDVAFGIGVAILPILAVWASVRLLCARTARGRKSSAAVHLVILVCCGIANVFAGGMMSMGGGDAALAFILALGLQAIAFILTVIAFVVAFRTT
jgi:hypothetical protein